MPCQPSRRCNRFPGRGWQWLSKDRPFATSRDLRLLALPAFDVFNRQTQFIDAFNRGTAPFEFSASADRPWIKLSETHGSVVKEERLLVSIDWAGVSEGENDGTITLTQKDGAAFHIRVRALNPPVPARDSLQGFVEGNHYVSIEAEHFTGQDERRRSSLG